MMLAKTLHKRIGFGSQHEAEHYVRSLFDMAQGVCALTGLAMQTKDGDDAELRLSIDRRDSGGCYEHGNIQLVGRFANRWKRDSTDAEFTRLLGLFKAVET